jgi:hypothetical protein
MALPQVLYAYCFQIFLKCSQFETDQLLQAVFNTLELGPFRANLPQQSPSKAERVSRTIDYLLLKYLDDNRPAFPYFILALRDRYDIHDQLYIELNELHRQISQAMADEVNVPFVVAAMNRTQATDLFNEVVFDDPNVAPIERIRFQEFKQALNIDLADLLPCYQQRREDWTPPIYRHNSIGQIIVDMLNHINEYHRQPKNLPRLLPDFLSEDFFTAEPRIRRRTVRELKQFGGVLVVDAVSMFHPLLRELIIQAEISSNSRVALLILSPIDTSTLPVVQLIEQVVALQMETAFTRFDDDYDHLCEIGVGNLRALKRWLVSILPETASHIQMENPSPVTQQRWRNEQNIQPRGYNRLIFSQGGGQ